jgi:hypothetical protein
MGVLIALVVVAVVGIALAWWWVGRARAVERNARTAASRAAVDARIKRQYRSSADHETSKGLGTVQGMTHTPPGGHGHFPG